MDLNFFLELLDTLIGCLLEHLVLVFQLVNVLGQRANLFFLFLQFLDEVLPVPIISGYAQVLLRK